MANWPRRNDHRNGAPPLRNTYYSLHLLPVQVWCWRRIRQH